MAKTSAKIPAKAPSKSASASMARAATGIPGFDGLVEGGLKRNSVVGISGDAGSGKTTFAMQFLYNGATKYNEPGIFISLEQSREALLSDLGRYGWDLAALEKKNRLRIIALLPHEAENFQNYELQIQSAIEETKAKRLALDSVTSIVMAYKSDALARQGIIRLAEKLRSWGLTSILTSESTTDVAGNVTTPFKLDFLTDAAVYLYNMRKDNYRLHAMEVMKMRGTSVINKVCPLKFGKTGIEVFPNQNVFK